AKQIVTNGMPRSRSDWLSVPGVGAYTAAAISSICFHEVAAVVDGNVARVYARFRDSHSMGSKLWREASDWAQKCIPGKNPAEWNQAIMELGATVCTPRSPRCHNCPIVRDCRAHVLGKVDLLPWRTPKPEITPLKRNAIVPICKGKIGMSKS